MNDLREHFRDTVLKTPFYPRAAELNIVNDWKRWAAYTVANTFESLELEYAAIRNGASVFDLTPMAKYRITGPDALAFLNKVVTRDLSKLGDNRVAYTVWCNDRGQVIDDGTVFRFSSTDFRLCAQERQLDWLMISALGFDVAIEEETDAVPALALQGPASCTILQKIGLGGIEELKPFDIHTFKAFGTSLTVSRTGYTGDLGYELWIDPAHALDLWDALFEAGAPYAIRPIGTAAINMIRVEAGFLMAGVDFMPALETVRDGHTRSPFELGLGWTVNLKKEHFTGKQALLAEKENGSRYRFIKLDVEGNKTACDAFIYAGKSKAIGTVTTAAWSPILKKNLAFASVEMPWGKIGDELFAEIYYQKELKWTRKWAKCTIVEGLFFDPERRRKTPPDPI